MRRILLLALATAVTAPALGYVVGPLAAQVLGGEVPEGAEAPSPDAQSAEGQTPDSSMDTLGPDSLNRIWLALDLPGALDIMREEGEAMTDQIADDYLPNSSASSWVNAVARIYDPQTMARGMQGAFGEDLAGVDPQPVLAFFESDLGQRIIRLEMSARRAFLDEDTEEAARERVRSDAVPSQRAELIEQFITANDLVEYNTAGAMNTNLAFLTALSQAEIFEMSEQDILAQVYDGSEENRRDTEEWLRAYLTMAYQPLSDEELGVYIDFSRTEEGQRLNRALFAGFGEMYTEQYRAIGLAVARQLTAQEL